MADVSRRALLAVPLVMAAGPAGAAPASAFDFRFTALEGGELALAQFRGKPMLVVNTASFCGFTRQYEGLQALHERLSPRGLVVLGVPSNDFNQESAQESKIREFCDATYGIDFPMAGLTRVRGAEAHPFYRWAAERGGAYPRWNFNKQLVSRCGTRVLGAFGSGVEPESPQLLRAVDAALAEAC